MGRYDLRAQRVLASANLALETNRISSPPVWHQVIQDIPPPPRLARPIKQHNVRGSGRNKFRPSRIKYPEDKLRADFFGDHPWELARPRVVLEEGGDDHSGYEWGRLEQVGKRVDGESVIQHQHHLMTHSHFSSTAAYDTSRKQFYTHRHLQDIERRIAREEALHTGAYFGPSANQLAEPLEDAKFEGWKKWAARRVATVKNMRMAGYSGSEVEDGEGSTSALAMSEEADELGRGEVVAPEVEQTAQGAVAEAAGGLR